MVRRKGFDARRRVGLERSAFSGDHHVGDAQLGELLINLGFTVTAVGRDGARGTPGAFGDAFHRGSQVRRVRQIALLQAGGTRGRSSVAAPGFSGAAEKISITRWAPRRMDASVTQRLTWSDRGRIYEAIELPRSVIRHTDDSHPVILHPWQLDETQKCC